ncbi:phage tail tube protein [Brevundimonas sp. DC300-4]|uniref:phage tail tube protein n=1 Tax=Brevundimonas sp. DC300-4 TaxID=2804594 RepID=UPI003CFAC787
MAVSQATIGLGTIFRYRTSALAVTPKVFAILGEAVSIQPPQPTRETADVTHLASPNGTREFIGTLRTGGEASVTLNHTDAAYEIASGLFLEDELQEFEIEYPDGGVESFGGIVTGKPSDAIEVDSVRRFTLPIQVSGLPTYTPAA